MEKLSDCNDINRAWENIIENIKTSAKESLGPHELKQHTTWFDEEYLGSLDQRKQVKMQWAQDPRQSKVRGWVDKFCLHLNREWMGKDILMK